MKRIIAILLSVCMVFSFVGCKETNKNDNPETSADKKFPQNFTKEVSWNVLENVDENFPFEEYVADEKEKWNLGRDARLDWWFQFTWHQCDQPMSTYETLKPVVDITSIDVTGRIPVGSVDEAVSLMMATGDFPDLITLDPNHPLVVQLINGGFVYTIDELIEKYEPGFKEEAPEPVIRTGTYPDGKWWGVMGVPVPEWKYKDGIPYDLGNQGYNVRYDIWEALGKPSIATPDDLFNTLKLFKEKYPKLNGRDSIGLVGYGPGGDGTLITMGNSFGVKQNISIDKATGKVTTKFLDPNFPEFMEYMNKLYLNGLLDPEFFVKDVQAEIETAANNAFMMPWVFHALDAANALLREQDENSIFVSIPPMSATGKDFSFAGSSTMRGESMTLIPKKCTDPEAAIRLIRYGYSSAGSMQLWKGSPGKHYYVTDGVARRTPEVVEAYKTNAGEYNKRTGLRDYYSIVYLPIKEEAEALPLIEEYSIPNTFPYSYDSTCESYMMTPDPTSDAGVALTLVNQIGGRALAAAIMAKSADECKTIVNEMIAEIKTVPNLDVLEDFYTNQYKSNVEKFGEPKWGTPN